MEWLERCHGERRGRYADIGPLVDELRARGWAEERLVKNDLIEPKGVAGRKWDHAAFWNTIVQLTGELEGLGLPAIFIKCVREYPYCDSNVDVLVPRRRMREVARQLYRSAWVAPELWDQFEQLLIERAKLKLPSTRPGLITAHLYGGVSWRYQSDIGMLRRDGVAENPDQLQRTAVGDCVPQGTTGVVGRETMVWLPDDASELVLQAAHVAYENFRITVGEALHFRLLVLRVPEALEAARERARENGCESALQLLDDESRRVVDGLLTIDPADYPRTLPRAPLTPAFAERSRLLRGRGETLAAIHESGSMRAVYALVSNIRRFRRWRRGAEDYRY